MRAGRVQDLPGLRALWAHEVLNRGRDCVPSEAMIARMMGSFDWGARSRVIEDRGGVRAAALVLERVDRGGRVARVETAARAEDDRLRLIRWGLATCRAAGAALAQVWRPRGQRRGLAELGLELARPFWRMDRRDLVEVPTAPLPAGYRLAAAPDRRQEAMVFNRAFAEHWRFQALDPDDLSPSGRPPDLELMAVTAGGDPAAIVWCDVETHDPDLRPQPVGVVEVVGTLPEHRRQGLAYSLTAEALRRLRGHGATSSSLYVDGLNPTRAYDVYGRLGYSVAYQYDVYELDLSRPAART
ncbi:MAG TPA: GNAT family N-acetyltransferase [Candidatus Dormibacteraeota bacterium]|nr:GNAT family N-acetyltransferase [Candidatus Dormibacteraeota bacterium]